MKPNRFVFHGTNLTYYKEQVNQSGVYYGNSGVQVDNDFGVAASWAGTRYFQYHGESPLVLIIDTARLSSPLLPYYEFSHWIVPEINQDAVRLLTSDSYFRKKQRQLTQVIIEDLGSPQGEFPYMLSPSGLLELDLGCGEWLSEDGEPIWANLRSQKREDDPIIGTFYRISKNHPGYMEFYLSRNLYP